MDVPRPLPRPTAALCGIAAVGAGVAVAHVVAALLDPRGSPLIAVGGASIDLTPTPLKEFAVRTFGTADKAVLLLGIAVTLTVLAAGLGLIARRRPWLGAAGVGLIGLIAAAAATARPNGGPEVVLPSLLGAGAGAATLVVLARPRRTPATGDGPHRRGVLVAALGIIGLAAFASAYATILGGRLRDVDAARSAVRLPRPTDPAPTLPESVDLRVKGVAPFRVPNADFYRVDTALVVPSVNLDDWRLAVGGMVSHPFTITYDELLSMPMVERDITLTCVSNEVGGQYVGNARWLGVRLNDLLDRAGVDRGADQLLSRSVDGFTASTPMAVVREGRDALVVVAMNGEVLPAEHGFPARMVIPGLYGFVSATKWLTSLEAKTYAAEQAYWTVRGWATDAPVRTMARIEVPRPLSNVRSGSVAIAGTCWAQHRGIDAVEVQIDDEPWARARLGAAPSVDTWRQWWLPWFAPPGRHVLRVRATDGDGNTQPEARLTPFPSGAQGWHEVVVNVS